MICINCSKLALNLNKRNCIRCNKITSNNLSVLCDECSNSNNKCAFCLKTIKNDSINKKTNGCGCGK